MNDRPKHSSKQLPNTPRVSDKIKEYYDKFGHGRDLEKFMRLYSPASSQESKKSQDGESDAVLKANCKHTRSRETMSSNSSCDGLELMPSRPLSVCGTANSKSLPNIGIRVQNARESEQCFSTKDVVVDINIETKGAKEKILSVSTENLETPRKSLKNTKTQTPESVAKTHRRLEWDSLGDIGYQKSMSTSNVSVLEKCLLKAFFKESSAASQPSSTSAQAKTDSANKDRSHQEKQKTEVVEHSTPPLASSTLVESHKSGTKPKQISKSTSCTSLQEKFEKYAQTSLRINPTVESQEIQCSLSVKEGDTATPSSFEYYSSRSSKSITPKSSDNLFEHPFITSITELLMKRKAVAEKNHQNKQQQYNNIRELQTKFKAALDENKENQTYSSTSVSSTTSTSCISLSKKAPELDLGIQLICSLIDAKSVNEKQKKQLIREIVKRLTKLEVHEHTTQSASINISSSRGSTSTEQTHDSKLANSYDSVCSNIISKHKGNMSEAKAATKLIVIPITEEQVKEDQKKSIVTNSSNENVKGFPVTEQYKNNPSDNMSSKCHYFPCKTSEQLCDNVLKESNINGLTAGIQSEKVKTAQRRESFKQKSSPDHRVATKDKRFSKPQKILSITSIYATSSSTSQDLTTQKYIDKPKKNDLDSSNNTDAEQSTMREWLNPLTQSEIEYEKKKREESRKNTKVAAAIQKVKCLKKASKHDCGRVQQLNWIENEIKRLECLKHLLIKDVKTEQSSSTNLTSGDKNLTKNSTHSDKLYDTVYSDKSSVLSESAERLVQEIEIILEESHEDVINIKDNLKKSRDRKKETQVVYEKENSCENRTGKIAKPKFRSIKETININEEQLLNGHNEEGRQSKQIHQREKIDTPCSEKSQEPESLKDMVQQRKKEFMKAYKTKKQQHYEALKHQQQKEDFKYLNLPRAATATTGSEHYSIPHTMPRKFSANELSYAYTQNPLPLTPPTEGELKSHNHKAKPQQNIIYSTTAAQPPTTKSHNAANSTTTTTTSSSTSMLCISSDVSVPMGSCNTSSTPTTTHQYDDVAAVVTQIGIAVQTSDSMMYTKPIYGQKQMARRAGPFHCHATTTKSSTACIQVKPKGIAYVIEFNDDDDNNKMDSNSNSASKSAIKINSKTKSSLTTNTDERSNTEQPQLTLQEHLQKRKPKFLQHSNERKAILNQLQSMRQERGRQIREIIDNTSCNSLEKRLKNLPPPPTQKIRILNTKAMKALTNKRFTTLPEVVAKQERETEEKKRRSNRILRDVFNRRLQNRVHNGKLSLNHSKTLI